MSLIPFEGTTIIYNRAVFLDTLTATKAIADSAKSSADTAKSSAENSRQDLNTFITLAGIVNAVILLFGGFVGMVLNRRIGKINTQLEEANTNNERLCCS